jgi:glyoxylase-like metal-dependent hydrolase (beta-lactamase superfamily II)
MMSPLLLNRRTALKVGIETGIVSLLGLRTAAAEDSTSAGTPTTATQQPVAPRTDPAPLVDARFPCEIAEHIWIIPDRRIFLVPNIGIVVGKKAALVIDCGLGPQCGKQVIEAAEKIAPGRQLILTQTHAHPEHVFGALPFKNRAQIFLNRQQNEYLVKKGPTLLQLFRERFGDAERELLADAEVVPATDTYDGDRGTLDLGGRQVEFHAIGTAHSPGDQIIWLPKEKILFAGDLIEERMFPIVPFFPPTITKADIDVAKWVEALSFINDEMRPSIIVPGHGNLGQAEIARALLVYFTDVQMRVRKLADGGNIDTMVSELKPQIKTTYSTWEHDRFIEPAIRYFAQTS